VESCPAWNDLKESRNAGNLSLEKGERYRVQRHYKGHYLIRYDRGGAVSQRWVREKCLRPLGKERTLSSQASAEKGEASGEDAALHSLLVLTWHNAFCETHPNRKECRPLYNQAASHLVLHGLWPQPPSRVYCHVPPPVIAADKEKRWGALPAFKFPPDLQQRLIRYMPGVLSKLERHEWVKHGSCYDRDPLRYFDDALSLTEQVDRSMVGEYLRANEGKKVSLLNLRKLFERSFGKGAGTRLAMECRRGLLTELRISLKGKGKDLRKLLKGAPALKSRCREGIVDAPGLYRKR
jgi:ribonuclease T2